MSTLSRYVSVCLVIGVLLSGCGGSADNSATSPTVESSSSVVASDDATPIPADSPTEEVGPVATASVAESPTEEVAEPTAAPEAPTAESDDTSSEVPSLSPADAVRAAIRAQFSGGPYHVESALDTDTFTLSGDVIPPDQISSTLTTGDGRTTQIIITDGQMWINNGDGWGEPMSGEMVTSALSQMVTDPESADIQFSNEQFEGVDAVNGSPAWVYTYTTTFGSGEQAIVSNSRLWVEIATGLPVKLAGTATVMGLETTTTQLITYDDSITISPPQ